jgi:hypothetical protein
VLIVHNTNVVSINFKEEVKQLKRKLESATDEKYVFAISLSFIDSVNSIRALNS